MTQDAYGQREQMEDPTMVGTLQAQIDMIWPHELPVLERLGFPTFRRIADLGCGTGRFAGRVAETWPQLQVRGIDLFEPHLEVARRDFAERAPNVAFDPGDARATGWEPAQFDVVALRHLVHALGDRDRLYEEAHRLLRPGGAIYVLAEDYAALHFDAPEPARSLFRDAGPALMPSGTNLEHGREAYSDLRRMGFADVRVEPVYVDTCNTPREPFARMLHFWRDGYADFIADHLKVHANAIRDRFDALIACVEDPERFACWLLFAVTGRRPNDGT